QIYYLFFYNLLFIFKNVPTYAKPRMSTKWLKNFAGVQQSEVDIQNIPNALVELGIHITCKTIQVGTLLGSVVGPLAALVRKTCPKTGLIMGGARGALIGAFVGPVVTVATTRNKTEPEIIDRCYRLRHNEGQLWVDRSFVVAATLGFMAAGTAGLVAGVNGAVIITPIGRAAWKKMTNGDAK
ncbi:hypothetical protein PRIPAC_78775, partial [Pristionchus pacificus]